MLLIELLYQIGKGVCLPGVADNQLRAGIPSHLPGVSRIKLFFAVTKLAGLSGAMVLCRNDIMPLGILKT
jgi:hypothetical protein